MKEHPSNLGDEGMKLLSYCPLCETREQPSDARILGEQDDTRLVHMRCDACENAVLALVMTGQQGASSIGLVTDLTGEDVLRFRHGRDVSVNDVIRMHEFLEAGDASAFAGVPALPRSRQRDSAQKRQTRRG